MIWKIWKVLGGLFASLLTILVVVMFFFSQDETVFWIGAQIIVSIGVAWYLVTCLVIIFPPTVTKT